MVQANTKTQILDVAQDLVQRFGVNGMSYKDISEVVGIRKASVHTHFPKKEDLLVTLLERYGDRLFRRLDDILASDASPESKLRQYCGLFEATLDSGNRDKACLGGMIGAELVGLSDRLAELVCTFYQSSEVRLTALLESGRDAGDFRFAGSAEDLAALILASMQGGLLIARVHGGPGRLHREIEQLIALVKGG